ncbi:MAG TPA: glycosyltransferase family 4 protein [Alphaproteobacteria bacterium]|nr:glycosyltransferase family 4 protein [Alphaproteobacteria bacterium]
MPDSIRFAVPGDIETRTGGTIYDKRVIAELRAAGRTVEHLQWPASFPFPSPEDLVTVGDSLAACPDGALVMIDGLAFGAMPELAAVNAQRLRLVALVHHPLALESGLQADIVERLRISERKALKHARAVIVTSALTAATLARDFGVPPETIMVATPGVDRPAPSWVSPSNPVPQLLAVGTVTPRKAHDVLVDALARIAGLDWHCTIAGSLERAPETVASVRRQIERRGLARRIDLIGEVADSTALYGTADIFVLPSRYEGYGMAIAEALVYGMPVIAARVGAIPEVVPDSAGILVPPDDPGALADALQRLIEDRTLRRRYSDGARLAAQSFAEWRGTAARIASALDAVE